MESLNKIHKKYFTHNPEFYVREYTQEYLIKVCSSVCPLVNIFCLQYLLTDLDETMYVKSTLKVTRELLFTNIDS
jgi:hypothetical protein